MKRTLSRIRYIPALYTVNSRLLFLVLRRIWGWKGKVGEQSSRRLYLMQQRVRISKTIIGGPHIIIHTHHISPIAGVEYVDREGLLGYFRCYYFYGIQELEGGT
jgi:hypothetical protein